MRQRQSGFLKFLLCLRRPVENLCVGLSQQRPLLVKAGVERGAGRLKGAKGVAQAQPPLKLLAGARARIVLDGIQPGWVHLERAILLHSDASEGDG